MKMVAYMRCSTKNQSHGMQRNAIKRHSGNRRLKWYVDVGTGRNAQREALQQLLSDCRQGKVSKIICYRLDRLSRSTIDLCRILNELIELKVELHSVGDSFTLGTDSHSKFVAQLLGILAEHESNRMSERIREGLDVARKNGVKLGAKPNQRKRDRLIDMLERGKTVTQVAKTLRTSPNNIYQMRRRMRLEGIPV